MLLTYDFQDQVRDLSAGIDLIIADEPTLLGLVGMDGEPVFQTKFEWMSDRLNSNIAVVKDAVETTVTDIVLAEGEGEKFRVDSIVVCGEEYMKVTAVNGDTITVERGFDNTTPAAIDAGAKVRIVGRPQVEGALPGKDEGHDRWVDFNYTQIIERYAAVSNTQMAVRTHNVENELNYQVELRLKEMAREFNDWLIYGRRIEGQPRMTGGLLYFAELKSAPKMNLSGAEVSEKAINDLMEEVYLRGGNVNTILTNTAGARQISKLAKDQIRVERTDRATGHQISTFVSDIIGGNVASIIVDPNFPRNKVALFDRNIIKLRPLKGRTVYDEDASVPGADFIARQIRGEYGIEIKNAGEKIAILENISTEVSA
jgi:hypothetical protein